MNHFVRRPRKVGTSGALAIALFAFLSACTGTKTEQSSVYQDAYEDGCDSGYTQALGSTVPRSADKDERQYTTDVNYRRGWYDGYRQCYADATRAIQSRSGGGGR